MSNHASGGRERKGRATHFIDGTSGLHDSKPSVWRQWQRPWFLSSQVFWDKKIKRWRSVGEQIAKYSRCVPVRARLSKTKSPALAVPCNREENKDRNYMFIFDNNFNLLCSPSRSEMPTKSRWESVLLRLKVQQREITESTWCICQFLLNRDSFNISRYQRFSEILLAVSDDCERHTEATMLKCAHKNSNTLICHILLLKKKEFWRKKSLARAHISRIISVIEK